ncbi:MAG: hypothetical protein ACOZJX_16940 [Pseudomonadota bacterium]
MWSSLKQRLADAHPMLRVVALSLALAVTVGVFGLFAHLGNLFYEEAVAAKELATPPDNYVLVTAPKKE